MNRWILTNELEQKYLPVVRAAITEIETNEGTPYEKDFSDTGLNPSTLCDLLEKLGYTKQGQEDNGWELDFWITMSKVGCKPLKVQGTGMTFELLLVESEDDINKPSGDSENPLSTDGFEDIIRLIREAEALL